MQRLTSIGYPVIMLVTQYRMHPMIAEYSSWRFYNSRLLTDSKLIDYQTHERPYHKSSLFQPFVFHDVYFGKQTYNGTSISNRAEAEYIAELYQKLRSRFPSSVDQKAIGIIAPYSAQRQLLNSLFREKFGKKHGVEISTIDGFQGREKDIIIFSCVRAPLANSIGIYDFTSSSASESGYEIASNTGIGFLKEKQRLNVAITRAKYAVWIVGCRETLMVDSEWSKLIDYCRHVDGIVVVKDTTTKQPISVKNEGKLRSKHSNGSKTSDLSSSSRPPLFSQREMSTNGDSYGRNTGSGNDRGDRGYSGQIRPHTSLGTSDNSRRPRYTNGARERSHHSYYVNPGSRDRIFVPPPVLTVPTVNQHHTSKAEDS